MFKRQTTAYKSILCLTFDSTHLIAMHLHRNGSGLVLKRSCKKPLALDVFKDAPELAGQELRTKLDEAALKESHCLVCLPVDRVMSHHIDLPPMSPEDERSYIDLHTEGEFPYPGDELSLSINKCCMETETSMALLNAVPLQMVDRLKDVLKAAKLQPVGLSVALPPLPHLPSRQAAIVMQQREAVIDFFVIYEGHIVLMRSFDVVPPASGDSSNDPQAALLRDLRISIGQLPEAIRESLAELHLYGSPQWKTEIEATLQPSIDNLGLQIQRPQISDFVGIEANQEPSFDTVGLGAALSFWREDAPRIELLPPHISPLQKIMQRMASRRYTVAGGSAAAVVGAALLFFGWQHWTLASLQSQWDAIRERVEQAETLQNRVKEYQPWFGDRIPSLSAMHTLAEAFPEEGRVWAKIMEFDENQRVSCSGFARSNKDLLTAIDQLNQSEQVSQLQIQQVVGESPVQFTFHYRWIQGGAR